MKNLISNDTSRCNNHRCVHRTDCGRYMQNALDYKTELKGLVPVTKFSNKNDSCNNKIQIDVSEYVNVLREIRNNLRK